MIKKILVVTIFTLAFFASAAKVDAYQVYNENITTGPSMTIGSSGTNVVMLQGLLSEMGYLNIPVGVSQGYFGTLTQEAVARYQTAQTVSPAAGYFGSITKIAMHQEFDRHNWLSLLGW